MPSKTLPISMAQTVAFSSLTPARKVMMVGERATALATHSIARAACEGRPVQVVCGDNRFDPYTVARFAKSKKVKPEAALSAIRIARAFTAYQVSELIKRLDPATSSEIVIISGPCSTFFDEDVSLVDAARLFYRVLWRIVELAREGMTLLMVQGQIPVDNRRAYFLTDLCRASDVVLHLGDVHTFRLEQRGRRRTLPRLAAIDYAAIDYADRLREG